MGHATLPVAGGNVLNLLTPRQRAVYVAMRDLGSVAAVSRALRLSPRSVQRHRARAAELLEALVVAVRQEKGSYVHIYALCYTCRQRPKAPGQSQCRPCASRGARARQEQPENSHEGS